MLIILSRFTAEIIRRFLLPRRELPNRRICGYSNRFGNSGLVAIVSDGDANVYAKAQVSGQNKQAYNNCYFEFETRSQDAFFMSGDSSNKITVFEKEILKPSVSA